MGARGRRSGRLKRSAEFDRAYRKGRSASGRLVVLHVFEQEDREAPPRLGLAVGRKVGGAVQRNRAKRIMRAAFRELADTLPGGLDLVLTARRELGERIEEVKSGDLVEELRALIQRLGLEAPEQARGPSADVAESAGGCLENGQ